MIIFLKYCSLHISNSRIFQQDFVCAFLFKNKNKMIYQNKQNKISLLENEHIFRMYHYALNGMILSAFVLVGNFYELVHVHSPHLKLRYGSNTICNTRPK